MTTLDRVIQMQQEGKADNEIITQLRNEGIRPSEITNAIGQAKIKNAVSPPEQIPTQYQEESGMQPSIMPGPGETGQQPVAPAIYQQEEQQQQNYYTPQPQAYSEQEYYPQQGGSYETETISEIAEQVATEKLEDYKSKVGDIVSFKNQIQNKVRDIDDRLKRIENSIDKLQQAILGRVGEFGESSAMIHRDLENLHGTMAKLMNPLIDNINEMKRRSN